MEEMRLKMDDKCRVTIPKSVRKKMGLDKKSSIEVEMSKDKMFLKNELTKKELDYLKYLVMTDVLFPGEEETINRQQIISKIEKLENK